MKYKDIESICKIHPEMLANRRKYKDGWYRLDIRGLWCHYIDLSTRNPVWSKEDLDADDWLVISRDTLRELNYRNRRYLTNE